MTPVRIGKPQTPYLIRGLESTFDILFALVLGKGTDRLLQTEEYESRSVTIVNKLSGKALEVENSSVHQGARVQQVTLSDAASQHWFVKFTKFIRRRTIPRSAFLRFPQSATRSSQIIAGYVWTSRTARWTKLWPHSNPH
jgi:ricin-type beta-trefoil lectin protein